MSAGDDPRAARLVRTWTRWYTGGLPDETARRRRLEIESDLWEYQHDADETPSAWMVLGRCWRGVPADLRWRHRASQAHRRAESPGSPTVFRENWWVAFTALIGIGLIVSSLGPALTGEGTPSVLAIASATGGVASGCFVLAGLFSRTHNVVTGSWLIAVGCLIGGPFGLPLAAVIVGSGLWTGNLQFSAPTVTEPKRAVAHRQRAELTRRWYVWLGGAGVLFGAGLLFPLFVFTDTAASASVDSGNLSHVLGTVAWMTWWGSWVAAAVCAAIGAVLGFAGIFVSRRQTPTG